MESANVHEDTFVSATEQLAKKWSIQELHHESFKKINTAWMIEDIKISGITN